MLVRHRPASSHHLRLTSSFCSPVEVAIVAASAAPPSPARSSSLILVGSMLFATFTSRVSATMAMSRKELRTRSDGGKKLCPQRSCLARRSTAWRHDGARVWSGRRGPESSMTRSVSQRCRGALFQQLRRALLSAVLWFWRASRMRSVRYIRVAGVPGVDRFTSGPCRDAGA